MTLFKAFWKKNTYWPFVVLLAFVFGGLSALSQGMFWDDIFSWMYSRWIPGIGDLLIGLSAIAILFFAMGFTFAFLDLFVWNENRIEAKEEQKRLREKAEREMKEQHYLVMRQEWFLRAFDDDGAAYYEESCGAFRATPMETREDYAEFWVRWMIQKVIDLSYNTTPPKNIHANVFLSQAIDIAAEEGGIWQNFAMINGWRLFKPELQRRFTALKEDHQGDEGFDELTVWLVSGPPKPTEDSSIA